MVIMDSFALPVQGTETRVNAGNEAAEYMVQYTEGSEKVRGDRQADCSLIDPSSGWTAGTRHWMVSFSSRVWVLAVWHRREHRNE